MGRWLVGLIVCNAEAREMWFDFGAFGTSGRGFRAANYVLIQPVDVILRRQFSNPALNLRHSA